MVENKKFASALSRSVPTNEQYVTDEVSQQQKKKKKTHCWCKMMISNLIPMLLRPE